MSRKSTLEKRLTTKQRNLAMGIVLRDLNADPEFNGLTNKQLAEKVGISEPTYYEWKRNPDMNAYINILADEAFQATLLDAYAAIRRALKQPNPSAKIIQMVLQKHGKLTNLHEINDTREKEREGFDVTKELQELDEWVQ